MLEISESIRHRLKEKNAIQAADTDLRLGNGRSQRAFHDCLLGRAVRSCQAAGATILVHKCAPDVDRTAICSILIIGNGQVDACASLRPVFTHGIKL